MTLGGMRLRAFASLRDTITDATQPPTHSTLWLTHHIACDCGANPHTVTSTCGKVTPRASVARIFYHTKPRSRKEEEKEDVFMPSFAPMSEILWLTVMGLQTTRFRYDSVTFAYCPINSGPRNLDLLSARQAIDRPFRSAVTNDFKLVLIEPLQKLRFLRSSAKPLLKCQYGCVPFSVTKKCGRLFR